MMNEKRNTRKRTSGEGGERKILRTVVGKGGKVMVVLLEGVDVEGRGITPGLFEIVVMVLRSGGGVEETVAATVVVGDISTIN